MKTFLTILVVVAALALLSPFLVPMVLGLFAAREMNRRQAARAKHWSRSIRVHHGGKCACDLCDDIRHETLRRAANHE